MLSTSSKLRVGDQSHPLGSHINPAVSLGFMLMGKFKPRVAFGYVVAQLTGALLGSLPLLAWGKMGRSIDFGASLPGQGYSTWTVLLGEVVTTFGLIASLCVPGLRQLRRFTPLMIPFLYAIMVPLESPISGTKANALTEVVQADSLVSMSDMDSITDETGIDAQVGFSPRFGELVGMMESREEVGVSQLPSALTRIALRYGPGVRACLCSTRFGRALEERARRDPGRRKTR